MEGYVKEWSISSRALAREGVYRDIVRKYVGKNENILELGTGTGEMTKELWKTRPDTLLGVDCRRDMLDAAKRNLKREGLPMELNIDLMPVGVINGVMMGTRDNSNVALKRDAINLVFADYTNFLTMNNPAWIEYFDMAFLAFIGGGSLPQHCSGKNLLLAMSAIEPLLKNHGRFIYVERVFVTDKDVVRQGLEDLGNGGYRLVGCEVDDTKSKFLAGFAGNKEVMLNAQVLGGKSDLYSLTPKKRNVDVARDLYKITKEIGFTPCLVFAEYERT